MVTGKFLLSEITKMILGALENPQTRILFRTSFQSLTHFADKRKEGGNVEERAVTESERAKCREML